MSTLSQLSSALVALDEEMDAESFDPAQLVGDLKDKVDSIKFKIDEWESQAKNLDENWIKPLTQKKKMLEKKADKLREYCAFVLRRDQIEMLPGNAFSLKLRKSEAVEVDREPNPIEAVNFIDLVNTTITYAWKKKALADKIKAEGPLEWARIKNNFSAQFVVRKD